MNDPFDVRTDSPTLAEARQWALDALWLGRDLDAGAAAQLGWAKDLLQSMSGDPQGFSPAGLTAGDYAILRWLGVPFAPGSEVPVSAGLRFATAAVPTLETGEVVLLPACELLPALNAVQLKPLRHAIRSRFGLRLQGPPGCSLSLWSTGALLLSRNDFPVGGFLHGPEHGQRHTLDIPPGGFQRVRF